MPAAEVLRRYHQMLDLSVLPFWMDDFILGGFLLYGAWRTRHDIARGMPVLTAAWGFACGMGYRQLLLAACHHPGAANRCLRSVRGDGRDDQRRRAGVRSGRFDHRVDV